MKHSEGRSYFVNYIEATNPESKPVVENTFKFLNHIKPRYNYTHEQIKTLLETKSP